MELMQIEAGPLPEAEAGQSAAKFRAVEDAMEMQWMAEKECAHAGKEPPPYRLSELIGKGSFGRVYKAKGPRQGQIVAVKIMSIEEGDSAAPGESDTFAEILKEVSTLKLLNDSGAKNINTVIDTLLIGQSMWMVTEYCAGGSVSTLMHPTGSLAEKWIIPILREVAVAIFWVHKQGIIHRDIKCANVLITEDGGVQLCDFGVAGIVKTRFEKRSTITGTLQWMAPELFETNVTYGSEVDIWAFGSMAYEVATGLPPNATTILPDMDLTQFGAQLRESSPRLEGDEYSARLKDLIAFCMVPDASQRPRIEEIQKHPYICSTARTHPTDSLSRLVGAFRIWERQGGLRRSLFCAGGAHGPLGDNSCAIADDEGWDYGTMEEADQLTFDDPNHINVPTTIPDLERLPELPRQRRRRNRAPPNLHVIKPPLEKAFDQNTMSDYKDNARAFYNAAETSSSTTLPARRASFDDLTIRESPSRPSDPMVQSSSYFADVDVDDSNKNNNTIRPKTKSVSSTTTTTTTSSSSSSTGSNITGKQRLSVTFATTKTQDWTFPVMAPTPRGPLSPDGGGVSLTDFACSPMSQIGDPMIAIDITTRSRTSSTSTSASSSSNTSLQLSHRWGTSGNKGLSEGGRQVSTRISALSLIDLDAGMPTNYLTLPLISPINLGPALYNLELGGGLTPEDLMGGGGRDTYFSSVRPGMHSREPSMYIPFTIMAADSDEEGGGMDGNGGGGGNTRSPRLSRIVLGSRTYSDESEKGATWTEEHSTGGTRGERGKEDFGYPSMPQPPKPKVMLGLGSREAMKEELQRLIGSFREHLRLSADYMERMEVRREG